MHPEREVERRRQAQRLLVELLDLEPGKRAARLAEACGEDRALRSEVESLLAAAAESEGFLDTPAMLAAVEHGAHDEPSLAGRVVGGYELVEPIGRGGMGVVYRARQRSPERDVAVKVTPAAFSPAARRRFDGETRALAMLQHPGIALVLESGLDPASGAAWIAMEYVAGGASITAYAEAARLSLDERLALFAEACHAVHHGHLKGVIHRDLKPSNILVGADGRVKVIDFGIAKLLGSEERKPQATATGLPIGTLPYMSPEQCAGEAADVRSDVYSLGVVLHELAAGRPPFAVEELSLESALKTIRAQAPPPLRRVAPATPRDLETIVLAALDKDPARRYQSVAGLVDDLARLGGHRPIEARPAGWTHHAALFARRHVALVAAAAIVVLAMGVATAVSLRFAWVAERERDAAIRESYVSMVANAGDALDRREFRRLQQCLEEAPSGLRGWEWRYLARQMVVADAVFAAHRARVFSVAWSPTGDLLASGDINGSLRLWHADGRPAGEPIELRRPVFGLDFTSDGGLLAVAANEQPIRLFRVGLAGERAVLTPIERRFELIKAGVASLDIAPGDATLACAGEGGVRLWRLADGTELATFPVLGASRSVRFDPAGERLAMTNGAAIEIRRVSDGALLRRIEASASSVECVAWRPDGLEFASGDGAGRIALWDPASGEPRGELPPQARELRSLAYTPDGRQIVAAGADQQVRIYELASRAPSAALGGHYDMIHALALSPDGRRAATASSDRTARVWDLTRDEGRVTKRIGESWRPFVRGIAYSPDSTRLLVTTERGLLLVLDATTWETVAEATSTAPGITSVAFSPDGRRIAIGSASGRIELLRPDLRSEGIVLEGHRRAVTCLDFSPDGKQLASGGTDQSVRIWSLEGPQAGGCVQTFHGVAEGNNEGHAAEVSALAFARDGRSVFSAGLDAAVIRWDLATGRRRWRTSAHDDSITALALHPAGRELVSGGRDQRFVVYGAEDGRVEAVLEGHSQWATGIAFSSAGDRMFTASAATGVKVWDWPGRSELLTLRDASLGSLRSIRCRPDDREIVVGGAGAVSRWSVDELRGPQP